MSVLLSSAQYYNTTYLTILPPTSFNKTKEPSEKSSFSSYDCEN